MIGNLARRSEQTENKAVQCTDLRTRRTPARLAFADHMHRFIAGDRTPSSPASGAGQTRCRQTRLSAACASILAQVIPRVFGPDPQAVKTIVQRESRHWIHSTQFPKLKR